MAQSQFQHKPLSVIPEIIMTPSLSSLPPVSTSPAPTSGSGTVTPGTPGTLAERVAALEMTSPTSQSPVPRTASPSGIATPGSQVLDNGTNIGSASGRKSSVGQALSQPFNMERRGSAEGGAGRRGSRRGSGVVMTPQGAPVVYHTRTDVSFSLSYSCHI